MDLREIGELLKRTEWASNDIPEGDGICPECGGYEPSDYDEPGMKTGHEPGCKLQEAILWIEKCASSA
jgi:hypothetical protein